MTSILNRIFWATAGYTALPIIAPYYGWRMLQGTKYRAGLRQRLSLYTQDIINQMRDGQYVWFHTVSVGELQAARPLLQAIKQEYPNLKTWVTTVTETGQNLAKDLEEVDACCYLPLDATFFCNRFLKRFHPVCLIIFETELWPNLIHSTYKHNIPMYMVNGRLSDTSFGNYQKTKLLFAPVLNCIDTIMTQSPQDAERFSMIGATAEQIINVGNIKFEAAKPQADDGISNKWRAMLNVQDKELLVVAGSTFPGEELLLAQIINEIQSQYPIKLLIAPRHIDRISSIVEEFRTHKITVSLRSQLNDGKPSSTVLLNTIGELKDSYAAADIVFIGKSILDKGGQNPLEPASWGKPVVFGPHMQNFRDIAAMLVKADGAIQVKNQEALKQAVLDLCSDPPKRTQTGQNALRVVNDNQGAVERIMTIIKPTLEKQLVSQ